MPVAQPVTVWSPESCGTFWSAPIVNDGASFTAVTSMVRVFADGSVSTPKLSVPPSSWTWNWKLA